MASSDVTANAEGTERSTFMSANIDKSVEMPASPRGKQLELHGTAIEEVIQQVSMLGIERGKILACLWKRLKSAMALYSTREQAWTLVLCSMHEELEQHKRRIFTGGGPASSAPLIASMGAPTRVGVLEPQSRLTNASISVRRHHDTVRWRSALQLAHREKIELTHTLEKLCKAILGDTLAGAVPVAVVAGSETCCEHISQSEVHDLCTPALSAKLCPHIPGKPIEIGALNPLSESARTRHARSTYHKEMLMFGI
jgi:hypothetical protein